MSAQPANNTPSDMVNIEIDGKAMQVAKGSMIIQAADSVGIHIPRFCYHPKLAIAANCRQCLVEVEMNGKPIPKPQPACATPVGEGMKVSTRSEKALHWQRDVMEFLLINHPLDCPICDQGGECELQDMALGYGRSVSRFTERKRTVADENIGPLIATEMTRCIQCTRCVRFMGEIAGTHELGGMYRGEGLEIGTYIGKAIDSEIGGNIIDVCPVGALTNKPFQFQARAWELIARPSIGYHDALGSNLWLHTRRGQVLRTVPRDNEAVNECWLSDRDRYSHQGLYAEDRLHKPMVKRDGTWQEVSWDEALLAASEALRSAGKETGFLVHPATSNEEGALLRRLASGLGSAHIDHRLRQQDLADRPAARAFGTPVKDMDKVDAALLLGCNLRHEMPLLSQRLRKAVRHGAKVHVVSCLKLDQAHDLAGETVVEPTRLLSAVLAIARVAADESQLQLPSRLQPGLDGVQVDEASRAAFRALKEAGTGTVIFGELASTHPQASWLRAAARYIAEAAQCGFNEIPLGANAIGLSRMGVLPTDEGLDARAMLVQPRPAYVLYGVDLPYDLVDENRAMQSLMAADTVVAFSAYLGRSLSDVADVILPLALLPESDGSLTNVDGQEQSVKAGAQAPGQAREGWKILRALGGELKLDGFDFTSYSELLASMHAAEAPEGQGLCDLAADAGGMKRIASMPVYRSDAVLRRASALNAHPLTRGAAVRMHADDAARMGVSDGDSLQVSGSVTLPVVVDEAVPVGAVWIESAYAESAALPPHGATLNLNRL